MAGDVIREVQPDTREGFVVVVEEGADNVRIPPECAGCLGKATKHLPSKGMSWPEFPYCDECVPPLSEKEARMTDPRSSWLYWLGGLLGRMFVTDVRGPRGTAVRFLLSESGTVRLAFENEEYARLFVAANGGEPPSEV